MQKRKKLGFFKKILLSMADFRFYPYILKVESLAKSFLQFIGFILLIVAVITVKYSINVFDKIESFINEYNEVVPEFTLKNGVLDIEGTDTVKVNDDVIAIINTEYKYDEFIDSQSYRDITRYDAKILINSDSITYETFDGAGMQLLFQDVLEEYDKISFKEYLITMYKGPVNKLITYITIYGFVFMTYFMLKFVEVLLFAVFASLASVIYGIRLEFKNYLKIAMYIITLPYIIETISIVFKGEIKDYALFVSNALAYLYIFYAIRAVKLDAVLLIMNNANKQNTDGKNVIINHINSDKENAKVENNEDSKRIDSDEEKKSDNKEPEENQDSKEKKD